MTNFNSSPDFAKIDARWHLWTPTDEEAALFTATRKTVEWLWSQRDAATDLQVAKAYGILVREALAVHAEAAEPPLTTVETDMVRSIAMSDLEGWKDRDHIEEWLAVAGRKGARVSIADFADSLDQTRFFKQGVTVSTHPVAVLMGRRDQDYYPDFAFAVKEPSLADWLDANRAALPKPPYVAPISIRECVEESEIVCDLSSEVAPLVITLADTLADEFRARFPHLIATFVPLGEAAAVGGSDSRAGGPSNHPK